MPAPPPSSGPDRSVGIYFVDVGQGDATVVLPPTGEGGAIVFDCRDDHTVGALLRNWGVKRISAVIVSHLDLDHIAGLTGLLGSFGDRIDRVFLSTDRDVSGSSPGATHARKLIEQAVEGRRQGTWELLPNTRDLRPVLEGTGWSVSVIAPEHASALERVVTGDWEDANQASAVLRVAVGETAVLVGGDAPLVTWSGLDAEELQAEVLRVPHHGGALDDGGIPEGWDVARLYAGVGARAAIVSVGTGNRYGHPNPEWVEPAIGGALAGQSRLICTQVTDRCQPDIGADVEAFRDNVVRNAAFAEPPWRHLTDKTRALRSGLPELPCAGTVVLRLSAEGAYRVTPKPSDHGTTVDLWRCPLCRPDRTT